VVVAVFIEVTERRRDLPDLDIGFWVEALGLSVEGLECGA